MVSLPSDGAGTKTRAHTHTKWRQRYEDVHHVGSDPGRCLWFHSFINGQNLKANEEVSHTAPCGEYVPGQPKGRKCRDQLQSKSVWRCERQWRRSRKWSRGWGGRAAGEKVHEDPVGTRASGMGNVSTDREIQWGSSSSWSSSLWRLCLYIWEWIQG